MTTQPSTGHARATAPRWSPLAVVTDGHARQVDEHLALCGDDEHTVAESRWQEHIEREDRLADYGGEAA